MSVTSRLRERVTTAPEAAAVVAAVVLTASPALSLTLMLPSISTSSCPANGAPAPPDTRRREIRGQWWSCGEAAVAVGAERSASGCGSGFSLA